MQMFDDDYVLEFDKKIGSKLSMYNLHINDNQIKSYND